jgi:lysophospholipase L1-like esterase
VVLAWCLASPCAAAEPVLEPKPADPFFAKFRPLKAPVADALLLKAGDRLAICGDSITQQRMYSRLIETYLAACVPELKLTVRQYGWSGETAEGFLHRLKNDCLRFRPMVATLCYGMNDYHYQPYDEATARGTLEEHNLCLCALRNIDVRIARDENVRFADVFWPMFTAGFEARHKFGPAYAVSGHDGVHPGGALDKDDSLRSGMALVPFNQDLNRLVLVVRGATAGNYKITWGTECRTY